MRYNLTDLPRPLRELRKKKTSSISLNLIKLCKYC